MIKVKPMISLQYLEDSPGLELLDERRVVGKLQAAAGILPISHLLMGWRVPYHLLESCRKAAERLGMRFIAWYPLLTPAGFFHIDADWQVEGLDGHKVTGYHQMQAFTFVCPNHPEVEEAVKEHLEQTVQLGLYQGFFFDRVRFPSPSSNPLSDLGCFCVHCRSKAAQVGLDLQLLRSEILHGAGLVESRQEFVQLLLSGHLGAEQGRLTSLLNQFIEFRKTSVTDFLACVVHSLSGASLEIGLDCFSPGLTHMVGQDLSALSALVDWVKVMTYAHTLGPAGIPYEISGLLQFLASHQQGEGQALKLISQSLGLQLPPDQVSLEVDGLSSAAIEKEVERAVSAISGPVLAGIELVELKGITRLSAIQLKADLKAVKRAHPAGLAISWDLLHIPLDNLRLVKRVYFQ